MLRNQSQRRLTLVFLIVFGLLSQLARSQSNALPPPELITDRQGLPQGFVPGLLQDRQEFIWMATSNGLCRYDGRHFKVFPFRPGEKSSLSFSDLRRLQQDTDQYIWITSDQFRINRFDPRTETFTDFSQNVFGQFVNEKFRVGHCYPDRQNRLWLALEGHGLLCFDKRTGTTRWFRHQTDQPHSLISDHVRQTLQDNSGTIWVATRAGLDRLNEKTGQFSHHHPGSQTPLALPENDLYSLYLRPSGEILIGSARYITQFNPRNHQIHSYRLPADGEKRWGFHFASDSRGTIYFDQRDRLFRFTDQQGPQLLSRLTRQTGLCASLLIDRSDVLWVGTDGSGIRKYDLRTNGFQAIPYQTNFQTDLLTNWLGVPSALIKPDMQGLDSYLFRSAPDHRGWFWINCGSSTFLHVNPRTREVRKTAFPAAFYNTLTPIATDGQGKTWVFHDQQLWWYNSEKNQWVRSDYHLDWEKTSDIIQMVADEQAFWFASYARGLFRLDRQTGAVRQYSHQPEQPTSLSNDALFCLSADPADPNRLWIGTFGSGLCAFDKRSGQFRRLTDQQGLPDNVIYSALPDQDGSLWIGTNKGLCRMNRKTFQMQTYTTEDGLLANEFNRFHYLMLPGRGTANGLIIMGGVVGLTVFQPSQLKDDRYEPKVELTALQVNNRTVEPGLNSPLPNPIHGINELSLPHDQNFLTVQFAAMQYNRPGKNRYRYKLEGIDDGWVESPQPQAIYTALPAGQYTLLVNASNTSGYWSPYVRKLIITILPPWWRTGWAYLLYGAIASALIWYGLRLYLSRLRLQQAVELRQQEARQLRALDEMKSQFFTNITHDFRTPLTLILSPLDGIIQDLAGTPYPKRLESVRRNAKQLLALINQLLDFSKLDAQMLTVHESRGQLADLVKHTVQLFREEAAIKSIELRYDSTVSGEYWFDAGKLERILFNLIANALKFTPAGGQITVSLEPAEGVLLTVSDTGIGIPPEKLPAIFDRFFQWSAKAEAGLANGTQPVGSGIGLALVKELVNLQHGHIDVTSQPGEGTVFRLILPYQRVSESAPTGHPATQSFVETDLMAPTDGEIPHLLLVEDNPELADFIADSLPRHYRVSRAANGAEGLQLAFAEIPNLVISDVMMPVMDGYALCQQLKDDERTSHIPVILLTAKVTFENRLEGLSRGADDYLTKPFHVQELNVRAHNLLERQRRFRERMQQELSQPTGFSTDAKTSGQTDPFLQKLYRVVEEKLDDTAFGVEILASDLNLSRVHLHRKVKALTGLSTSDLIRNYRLKRATQFLREGFNSSETAYRVGFDNPPYFAKCFRDIYHMSPGEFAKQG